jgi:5-methyltetrahydrofolate--homocysteine methyltransferase
VSDRPPIRQSAFLDRLADHVLVFDGAMGTSIQGYDLTAEDFGGKEGCNDYLVLTRPDVIEAIHESFLAVGCDVVETDTFNASRLRLEEYGLGEKTREVNTAAAQIARRVADRFSTPEKPRFVAGSMGPTGKLLSSEDPALADISFDDLAAIFKEQAAALVEGGVDLLIVETMFDILELKAAVWGIHQYVAEGGRWVPIQAQVTLDTSGRMLFGNDIAAITTTLSALDIQIIGLNCGTGPDYMREPVRYLGEHSPKFLSVIPNAGLPLNEGGRAIYPMTPNPMADAIAEFVFEFGVNVVGGCCGTQPEHLRAIIERIGDRPPNPRTVSYEPSVASGVRAVTLHQEPAPLLVGERVNSTGSRKVKRLLLADDYEGIVDVGRQQVEGGAHVLDVQVALTERTDEAEQMCALVKKLSLAVDAPLVIDSTDADVVAEALKRSPGRTIINSINLENGRERTDRVLALAKAHGAVVVALTIDEEGMAREVDHKVRVAKRIYDIAVNEYGLAPEDLIFDPLTLPLTTGDIAAANGAKNTLEGIRQIEAACPGVMTLLGISNVSFGIAPHARAVLNSVFMYHAVRAGLDLAIVNPKDVIPYAEIPSEQRRLAEDLIENRREDALTRFIAYFEQHGPSARAEDENENPMEGMSAEQRIHYQIVHRKKDGIEANIDEALTHQDAVGVLNNVMLPAMKEVGDKFGAGELILPFVLQSAEVMKRAVAHLEQFLERREGTSKGTVVLATVFGDVHDIGKNLVNTILTNNGYTVHDLGKQVPLNTIIDRAAEVNATAIGLSALLVSTSKQMPLAVKELHHRGLEFPILIGGAAINRAYGRRIIYVDDETRYAPGVFYCKDAFEGLETMDRLVDPDKAVPYLKQIHLEAEEEKSGVSAKPVRTTPARIVPKNVREDAPIPTPPFWGTRTLTDVPLSEVFKHLAQRSLFRLSWGGKGVHGEDWTRLLRDDFLPRLRRMQREAAQVGYMHPRAVYGYFPANSDGDDVVIYDPADHSREINRFAFTRQPAEERLSIADYFRPVESGVKDVVALQLVTVGADATERIDRLQAQGDYSESYYTHGLSVETAEALAEYTHALIRAELGLERNQGKRYSWGYPACPNIEDHDKVMRLLRAPEAIGVNVTSAYQLVPEQSTAAIVAHHPDAKYFSVITREVALGVEPAVV